MTPSTGSGQARLLVVGASGLVGNELARAGAEAGPVLGVARHVFGLATRAMDLEHEAQLAAVLADFSPTLVAVCSAWPHVDGCEADPARSHRENVETVDRLVNALAGAKCTVLFFSTDHVFDGSRELNREDDPVNPPSVYARHKREVEELLLTRGDAVIARTSWVFGVEARKKNFVYRVIANAQSGAPLQVPRGQAGCPTHSEWLARSALQLTAEGLRGVVHLSGETMFTKAEWAALVARELGLPALNLVELDAKAAGQVAPRPDRVGLRSSRHRLTQPPLESILRALRSRLVS